MVLRLDSTKLKTARALAGLTLREVADRIGTSDTWVSLVENRSERLITLNAHVRAARRLAPVYGLTSHLDLMTDDGEPENGEG